MFEHFASNIFCPIAGFKGNNDKKEEYKQALLQKYKGELTSDEADAIINGISEAKINELFDRGRAGGLFQRGNARTFEDIMHLRLTLLRQPCINLLTDLI